MKKTILMLAFCGALATMSAQNGTGGEDVIAPTPTPDPTYTLNPSTSQNPSNDNDFQGGTGQGGSDQGTNGSYQGDKSAASSQTQSNVDVPDKVKSSFDDKYQGANATWSREGQHYKARFKEDAGAREETIVVYDKNGEVVRTQRMLKSGDYPQSISKYYKDQNNDMKGYQVWEVTGNGPTKYYSSYNGKMTWFDNEGNVMHGTANATQGGHKSGSMQRGHSSSDKKGSKSQGSNLKRGSVNTGGDNTDTDIDRNR